MTDEIASHFNYGTNRLTPCIDGAIHGVLANKVNLVFMVNRCSHECYALIIQVLHVDESHIDAAFICADYFLCR